MAAIEKRGENSYRLTVSCGYDKQGKKIVKRKTIDLSDFSPKKQAEEAKRQWILFQDEVNNGTYLDAGKITFEKFVEKWLADYAEKQLQPKTLYRYREMLDSRIIPCLGHLKLNKIQPIHLVEFYNNLKENGIRKDNREGGLSDRTVLHHHRLISSIFTTAVQWQLILNNPCERVKPPKVEKTEAKHYDETQAIILLNALESEEMKYKVMISLTLYVGLREGELMGLTWDNINLEKGILEINKASQYIPGKGTFSKAPKNESSKRLVSISEHIIILLKQYRLLQNEERLKCGELWEDNNLLFTQWNGKPMHPYTPTKWFPKFIKRYNDSVMNDDTIPENQKKDLILPMLNFHGLRHTNASLLIAEGMNIKTISSRLGHSTVSTTLDIYSHSLRSADKEAANRLEKLLDSKKNSIHTNTGIMV